MTTDPTGHLPECYERELIGLDCICDRLRACEQRVREDDNRALWDDRQRDAERTRVAAEHGQRCHPGDNSPHARLQAWRYSR